MEFGIPISQCIALVKTTMIPTNAIVYIVQLVYISQSLNVFHWLIQFHLLLLVGMRICLHLLYFIFICRVITISYMHDFDHATVWSISLYMFMLSSLLGPCF